MNYTLGHRAQVHLEALRQNPYPGRGIVVGLDESGRLLVQICWLMGRHRDSRNRVYDRTADGRVVTAAANPKTLANTDNLIYTAMDDYGDYFVVSNGDQTDTIRDEWENSFYETLMTRTYESDRIKTPRITGIVTRRTSDDYHPIAEMAVIRKSRWSDGCERHFYTFSDLPKGVGFCLTTYAGDGEPPTPYHGEPFPLPLLGSPSQMMETIWEALDQNNRVAIAVKVISIKNGSIHIEIINKYEKVSA